MGFLYEEETVPSRSVEVETDKGVVVVVVVVVVAAPMVIL
jgi:hypothetical protein